MRSIKQIALAAGIVAVVATPLVLAQTTPTTSSGGMMQSGVIPSGGSLAVDDRYVYVFSNGVIMRFDKATGQNGTYLSVFGDGQMAWGSDSGTRAQFVRGWGTSGGSGEGTTTGGEGGTTTGGTTGGG